MGFALVALVLGGSHVELWSKSAPLEDKGDIPFKSAPKGDEGAHTLLTLNPQNVEILYHIIVNKIVPYKNLNYFSFIVHTIAHSIVHNLIVNKNLNIL